MTYIVYYDFGIASRAYVTEDGFSADEEPIDVINVDSFRELYIDVMDKCPVGKVPVIVCYPLMESVIAYIDSSLNSLRQIVGGDIEVVPLYECPDVDIICNEEGKLKKMKLNRGLYIHDEMYDIVAGPFIFTGNDGEGNLVALSSEIMEKIYYMFKDPELFVFDKRANKINSIKCSSEIAEVLRENNISIIG